MNIDITLAVWAIIGIVLTNGGVSFVAAKIANGRKTCSKHPLMEQGQIDLRKTLQNLENAHKEDVMVKRIVKAINKANGK